MSKGGIVVLIIAAVVFCGLGFVIGQVVQASGDLPGSADDPAVTQSYVDKLVGERVSALQEEIEELQALIAAGGVSDIDTSNGDDTTGGDTTGSVSQVKVTTDSVNVRSEASTSASIVGSANNGDVLTYLDSITASDGVWYHVELSNGTEGYVASWLCGTPY